jgi:hypothetical protein
VCGGQPSPHKPRLVVSHSTCPPLSSSPHAHSFVLGTAVINTHTVKGLRSADDKHRPQNGSPKPSKRMRHACACVLLVTARQAAARHALDYPELDHNLALDCPSPSTAPAVRQPSVARSARMQCTCIPCVTPVRAHCW